MRFLIFPHEIINKIRARTDLCVPITMAHTVEVIKHLIQPCVQTMDYGFDVL